MKCPFVIKKCSKCGKLLVANTMNFYKDKNKKCGLRPECKICKIKYNNKYCIEHKDKRCESYSKYYYSHKEKVKKSKKEYKQTEKGKEVTRNSKIKSRHKRRAIEKNQTFTKEQIEEMMLFFDNCCAYSGKVLKDNINYSIDHIVPLSKGGDNLIYNLVPMDKNYNSSKGIKDMLKWYQQQEFYSEERLNKIYEWIEYAKNKWKDKE